MLVQVLLHADLLQHSGQLVAGVRPRFLVAVARHLRERKRTQQRRTLIARAAARSCQRRRIVRHVIMPLPFIAPFISHSGELRISSRN
jgi:hypothetical protein